jgi:hypothetical protein
MLKSSQKCKEESNEKIDIVKVTKHNMRQLGHDGTSIPCMLNKNQLSGVDDNHQEDFMAKPSAVHVEN